MADGTHHAAHAGPRVVAVTGATGFVGRYVVAELLRRGKTPRALVRDRDKADRTIPAGAQRVVGDVFDRAAMRDLAAGAAAVVHLIGIRREFRSRGVTFQRMHVDATRAALDAARNAGTPRFVHMSALGVGPLGATGYQRTKHEAETLVRQSELDWTIVRPSIIHGPDGEFVQMVKGWATGAEPPRFFLPFFLRVEIDPAKPWLPRDVVPKAQPVDVRDVAAAICDALDSPDAVGEVYPLGGPDALAWPDILTTIRDAIPRAKKNMQPFGIPGPAALAAALAAEQLGLGALLPFGPSEPVMGSQDNLCSNRKAQAHLGFAPRPFADAVRAYGRAV